jgi:hypothetical protein
VFAAFEFSSKAAAAVVAYWRFEESPANGAATTVLDSSGNGLTGTAIGSPQYRTDVPTSVVPATGAANKFAMQFDGFTQRIFVPDTPTLALTHSMTVEADVKVFGQFGEADDIVFRGDDRLGVDPYVLNVLNGRVRFVITNAANVLATVSAPISMITWVHVAGELDDTTGLLSVWVNGVMADSTITTVRPFATLTPGSNPGLGIGNVESANYNQYFDGLIDEVRISDQALAPSGFLPEPSLVGVALLAGASFGLLKRRR